MFSRQNDEPREWRKHARVVPDRARVSRGVHVGVRVFQVVAAEVAAYVTRLEDIVDPLNPRDAFTGGRTNASRLLVKTAGTGARIKYIDFTSQYPDKQKRCVSGGASDPFVRQPRRGGRASVLWTRQVRRGAASIVVASRVALPVQSKADVCAVSHVRGDGTAHVVLS